MTQQLTFGGDSVEVCTRCGLPRIQEYGQYDGTHCRTCRADDEETKACDGCNEDTLTGDLYIERIFMSPWDEEPAPTGFEWCQRCIDRGLDRDDVFYCDGCSRDISESHGIHLYYRDIDDSERVCLRCIQGDLEAGGVAAISDRTLRRVFAGHMFGMFFNVGELEEKGWRAVPFFNDRMVSGADDGRLFGRMAKRLHEHGHAFIIGYERLSTMGGEGFITLYWNPAVSVERDEVAA